MNDPEAWQEFIRNRRVFILGAGFSAAAGIPLTAALLKSSMQLFSAECPGIFARVNNYAKDIQEELHLPDYSTISFSELCTYLEYIELREYAGGERWSNAGCREKLALRFYLSKTIARSTPDINSIPDLYIRFAEQLNYGDVIITFNWDTLLEKAINKTGKRYTYKFDKDHIKICKLHGSINWRLGSPNNLGQPINTLDWQPLGFANGSLSETEMYFSNPALATDSIWDHYQPLGELQPFLVLPGHGKAFDVRANSTLWYKPEFYFASARDVFIIGLSLADDDHFVRSFFLHTLPSDQGNTVIINPDRKSRDNYSFLLKRGKSELIEQKFGPQHIELITNRTHTKE